MASETSAISLPFLVFITLFPLLAFAGDETGKALIVATCNNTDFPEECISALESNPQSLNARNVTSLSRIALEVTASKINDTASYVLYWVNHAPDNATRGDTLRCYYNYNRSIQTINDSLESFDAIAYDTAYQDVSQVNEAVVECQNIGVQVLNQVNTKMFRISRDVMTILHLLF